MIFQLICSYGAIEARKGNPPVMPAVMTPGGPLDLSSVLFRNRIIFVGQPVNSQVAQRVISQLVTLATIDQDADILVCFVLTLLFYFCPPLKRDLYELLMLADVFKLPWWKHIFSVGNL